MSDTLIHQRKADHIRLAAQNESSFRRKSTLLEEVELVHQALPELSLEEIDLSVTLAGKRLALPLYISGMTGGTEEARDINRGLARVAERFGIAFGLGSQRAMLKDPKWRSTYEVRDVAPGALIMANLGVVQAAQLSSQEVRALIDDVGADTLCIHLNPSMELIQAEGDRDFRGCIETIRRLVEECGRPIIVKETGAGLSREAGKALAATGVAALDVAGAGGTSWVGIETLRAASEEDRALGEELWDWGIPTAASLLALEGLGVTRLASGGISRGIDAARALALGATAAGMAGAFLKAFLKGGEAEVERLLRQVERSLKAIALLIGARSVEEFWKKPKVLGPRLRAWKEMFEESP